MIKAIVLDLGGVILKHKHLVGHIISQMFHIPQSKGDEIWKRYKNKLFSGEISAEQFLEEIKSELKNNSSNKELLKIWQTLYKSHAKVDRQILNFVQQLKRSYKVYLLTDTISVHDNYNKTRSIYNKFNRVFKSFEEGTSKIQGKQIFLKVLKEVKIKPEECVYIDDLEEYIKVARDLGIKGIVFNSLPKLKEELRHWLEN